MTRQLNCCTPTNAQPIDRFLARVFNDPFFAVRVAPEAAAQTTTIDEGSLALDISEDQSHYIVRASLPGFAKENVDIQIDDGVLSVTAQRTEVSEDSGEQFHRRERRFGSVNRRISLPGDINEAGANAELKDGVLTLKLSRADKPAGRKVQING